MWLITPYCDLVFVSTRLHEIVGRLAAEPKVGVRPARLFEAYRHFGRNSGVAIQNPG